MAFAIGLTVVAVLFIIGAPIWVGLSGGAIYLLIFQHQIDPQMVPITFFGSVDSFTIMASSFFLIAGNVMAHGGSAPYLYNVINSFFGRLKGGIAATTVILCMVYAAITGSTTATLAGVSTMALPNMLKTGYSRKFCGGLLCVCATLGQMIPPSVYMIIYGSITQTNAAELFMSGIIPGILCGLVMMVIAVLRSPKALNLDLDPEMFTAKARTRNLIQGTPALIMPLIILGGIYAGIVTPTEAAALASVYGIFISVFVYRALTKEKMIMTLRDSAKANSMIFLLVSGALLFAIPITFDQIPQNLSKFIIAQGLTSNQFLFAAAGAFLILGCFLDSLPILFLVVPVLLPALQASGVSLVHFNVITILAMQIGQVTPPFGFSLFVTSKMVDADMWEVLKEALPYMFSLIVMLVIIILVPEISTFLPDLMKK